MDNLQSITYHTFEQDPVKYQKYEEVRSNLMPFRFPKIDYFPGSLSCTHGLAGFGSHVSLVSL